MLFKKIEDVSGILYISEARSRIERVSPMEVLMYRIINGSRRLYKFFIQLGIEIQHHVYCLLQFRVSIISFLDVDISCVLPLTGSLTGI